MFQLPLDILNSLSSDRFLQPQQINGSCKNLVNLFLDMIIEFNLLREMLIPSPKASPASTYSMKYPFCNKESDNLIVVPSINDYVLPNFSSEKISEAANYYGLTLHKANAHLANTFTTSYQTRDLINFDTNPINNLTNGYLMAINSNLTLNNFAPLSKEECLKILSSSQCQNYIQVNNTIDLDQTMPNIQSTSFDKTLSEYKEDIKLSAEKESNEENSSSSEQEDLKNGKLRCDETKSLKLDGIDHLPDNDIKENHLEEKAPTKIFLNRNDHDRFEVLMEKELCRKNAAVEKWLNNPNNIFELPNTEVQINEPTIIKEPATKTNLPKMKMSEYLKNRTLKSSENLEDGKTSTNRRSHGLLNCTTKFMAKDSLVLSSIKSTDNFDSENDKENMTSQRQSTMALKHSATFF